MRNSPSKLFRSLILVMVFVIFLAVLVVPASSWPVDYRGGVLGEGPFGITCYCPIMFQFACLCGIMI